MNMLLSYFSSFFTMAISQAGGVNYKYHVQVYKFFPFFGPFLLHLIVC